ncbi:MAG: ABC transporter ATP-binding protein [Erysipelotrichales bacterium]|nr:ABC transporter ATP-binding protein [Erysipelotrichales bacterium]
MKVIEINNLTKKFGEFKALDNVNLTINKGEVFGFIGPNGAGKTTTIRTILGILKKTEGEVMVFGKDAWHDAMEIHKKIAYVPGDVNLWPNLTGGEVIDLFTSLQGPINLEKKERLIKMFDLDPKKRCRTYSKGNRQKVALIAAFLSDAQLFILDEPTSGLDPLMEMVFQDCVAEEKKAGKTILLSSHILSEVERLCDRVAIIRSGTIVETGTLAELRHLTRVQITVETAKKMPDLATKKGVHNLKIDNCQVSFQADYPELGNIISYLASYEVKKLYSVPPALEDLFMKYYDTEVKH